MEKGKLAMCVHFSQLTFDHKGQGTGKLYCWKNNGIMGVSAKALLSEACQLEVRLSPVLLEVCLDATKLVSAKSLPVDAPRSKTFFG